MNALVEHILAMADDAFLVGHPEWCAIVDEARSVKGRSDAARDALEGCEHVLNIINEQTGSDMVYAALSSARAAIAQDAAK